MLTGKIIKIVSFNNVYVTKIKLLLQMLIMYVY